MPLPQLEVVEGHGHQRMANASFMLKGKTVEPSTPLVDSSTYCYLCGNSDMIYEVYGILRDRGVSREQIFAEVYF